MQLFASFLVARPQRLVMRRFHAFVATARAIAEHDASTPAERLASLDGLRRGLSGTGPSESGAAESGASDAADLAQSCAAAGITVDHAAHIIQAAQAAVERPGRRSWSDLLLRCRYAAAPVGRFALDLHREDRQLWPAADALCSAGYILADVSRLGARHRAGLATPLPQDWLRQAGIGPDALAAETCSAALRMVLDRLHDGVGRLLAAAAPLQRGLANRALRRDAAVHCALLASLRNKLMRRDPLEAEVSLPPPARALALLRGLLSAR